MHDVWFPIPSPLFSAVEHVHVHQWTQCLHCQEILCHFTRTCSTVLMKWVYFCSVGFHLFWACYNLPLMLVSLSCPCTLHDSSVSIQLFLFLSLSLSLSLSLALSLSLFLSPSLFFSFSLYISLYICLSVCLCLTLIPSLPTSLFVFSNLSLFLDVL